ncbi:sensor histidine kinase [Salinimicrobium flavum]|uniref:histidine kinase n=1 Tax=Salinimicrobium flavum TaxID=1737065 RepID=A0ABW5IWZ3_9FLAO
MGFIKKIEKNLWLQYLLGIGSIFLISLICFLFIDIIGYHVVALILLLAVSILAMFLDIYPIVTVAILSALTWNFLFIQPKATFNINTPQDALLFLMYFVIAVMNAVFTSKIRKVENIARQRKEREKTLQLYNTLFSSLSHELKTPIATIIGAVDTLKINSDKLSQDNIHELFSEIDIAGNRLNRQVENLLSMSRLESDFLTLKLDWYDINEIIHSVIQKNQTESPGHPISFIPQEDLPLFKIDGILIEQVIHNIIHNALQYTTPGTCIKVETRYISEFFQIIISDRGKGFPDDKLDLVFEKFYRLPKTAAGGTGLGLSIAKGFVLAHNGTIKLENLPEKGAKFTISIPAETTFLSIYKDD